MALNKYLQQTYRLLNDQSQVKFNVADLVTYINEGRSQIASACQGVRLLATQNTTIGQEIYLFSYATIPASSGYGSVIAIKGVSIIYGNFRYTLQKVSFSRYQATIRSYANSYLDVPKVCAQFGQGVSGSLYLYPPPADLYSMEWDCIMLPVNLATDSDIEIIPYPWTDSIQFYAAAKALEAARDFEAADRFERKFSAFMKKARADSQPAAVVNWYGRG